MWASGTAAVTHILTYADDITGQLITLFFGGSNTLAAPADKKNFKVAKQLLAAPKKMRANVCSMIIFFRFPKNASSYVFLFFFSRAFKNETDDLTH